MTTTRGILVLAVTAALTACFGVFPMIANAADEAPAPAAADAAAPAEKAPAAAEPAAAAPAEPTAAPAEPAAAAPAKPADSAFPLPDDPRPYAADPYAKEIDRALNFLANDKSFGRWANLAILDLLQRKFGLHKRYSIAASFGADQQGDADAQSVQLLGRLTDANHKLDMAAVAPLMDANPVIAAMLKSLYCDQNPGRAEVFASLGTLLETHKAAEPRTAPSEYAITTIALDYQWLKENACATDVPGFAEFKDKVGAALVDLVKKGGVRRDVSYESVALLYYLGCGALVEKDWIKEIAGAQQVDGGWTYTWAPEMGVSDGHPTVFALWALLESALPDAPEIAMIPGAVGEKATPEKSAEPAAAEPAAEQPAAAPAEPAAEQPAAASAEPVAGAK